MKSKTRPALSALAALLLAVSGNTLASENFQLRYNFSGSLNRDMFIPPDLSGWIAGIAATYVEARKVTGNDGADQTITVPAGRVPVTGRPEALYPTYGATSAQFNATGRSQVITLGLGYITTSHYGGGRLAFLLTLPFARKTQLVELRAPSPALAFNPAFPAAAQAQISAGFGAQYQATLAAQGAIQSGETSGIGDAEFQAAWLHTTDRAHVLAGASLVVPTGRYSPSPGPDIGSGKFYTLRPFVQAGYLVTTELAVSGKLTLGMSTRNTDTNVRGGNWAGMELAGGYRTPVGVIGLQGLHIQQFQDDSNNPWGASRLHATNAGAFFTSVIAPLDATVTLQYMRTIESRNAKSERYTQIRLAKAF